MLLELITNLANVLETCCLNQQSTRKQESAFKRNPWSFAKSACQESSKSMPIFSSSEALVHFSTSFSSSQSNYSSLPSWINTVFPSPVIIEESDMSSVTPSNLRGLLKKYRKHSDPGEDGICCKHLKNPPTFYHFLATLYSKILLGSTSAPAPRCRGMITLLHKRSDKSCPANFRPIVLPSKVGKLFHKLLAIYMENFYLSNDIIDLSLQMDYH